jgi:ribonuclease P protein subunit RPR2
MKRQQPAATRRIARERISILFKRAGEVFSEDPALSDQYVERARAIAMKQRTRIEKEFRRLFCHHCHGYLVPGVTLTVRIHRGRVIATCQNCGNHMRYQIAGRYGRKKERN